MLLIRKFSAIALTGIALFFLADANAAGKKRKSGPSLPFMRVVRLDPIADRFIEPVDATQPMRVYGSNVHAELVTSLKATGNFIVLLGRDSLDRNALALTGDADPDPCSIKSAPMPSTHITARVDEISFVTGSRGGRLFYGFKRGQENPFNSGYDPDLRNEFPLRSTPGEPSWFGKTFNDQGGLHTGLDLGNEINFDLLLIGATIKRAQYNATLGLEISFRNRVGQPERRFVTSHGRGFHFDLSGHLLSSGGDFTAAIGIARDTAFFDAQKRVVKGLVDAITAEMSRVPMVTRLASNCDGSLYIAAGADYRISAGQRFYSLTQLEAGVTPTVYTVEKVFQTSSRVYISNLGAEQMGDELVSLNPNEAVPHPRGKRVGRGLAARGSDGASFQDTVQDIDAGSANLSIPNALKKFAQDYFTKMWKGLKAIATLPYRAWRYYRYDQDFKGGELWQIALKQASALANKSWAHKTIGTTSAWTKCTTTNCLGTSAVIVAVIDSGVDYNHRELRRNIFWDGVADTPGWDFISGDARPFDDHAHGTEIASVITGGGAEVVGVAPHVTVLPVKIFSPYGLTTSAALYGGFEYAVKMGAKIIVTGWTTERQSRALEEAIQLAQHEGVLVVAAAGEGGFDLGKRAIYPATYGLKYDHMLVVAGHDEKGARTRVKGFESNYGVGVDLAAPGSLIKVANPRNEYAKRSHTGLSAGYVAATAALLWSRCPKAVRRDIKEAILAGARTEAGLNGEVPDNKALFIPAAVDYIDQICK